MRWKKSLSVVQRPRTGEKLPVRRKSRNQGATGSGQCTSGMAPIWSLRMVAAIRQGKSQPCTGRSAAIGGRVKSFQAAAIGALPQSLGLGGYRKLSGIEAHVKRISKPESLGDLGNTSVQTEPPACVGFDASIVKMKPINFSTMTELPEDRFER